MGSQMHTEEARRTEQDQRMMRDERRRTNGTQRRGKVCEIGHRKGEKVKKKRSRVWKREKRSKMEHREENIASK